MSKQEVDSFQSFIKDNNDHKKTSSSKWCAENIDTLIKWHKEYKDIFLRQKYEKYVKGFDAARAMMEKQNEVFNKIVNGDIVKCICGANLRLVTNFNFIGCSDWTNKSVVHSKNISCPSQSSDVMTYVEFLKDPYNTDFGKMYLNGFRSYYEINKIMASVVFEFLFTINKEVCYCPELTASYFQGAVHSKDRANVEETVIKPILEQKFKKVVEQCHIKYSTDVIREQVSIPDFVCSNDSLIVVFDVKKDIGQGDLKKLNFYQDLVEFIRRKQEADSGLPPKKISSYTILYSEVDDAQSNNTYKKDCRGLFIDDLKALPIV